jgi:N-acetylglucosamine kinase-like BadF-type ATPase
VLAVDGGNSKAELLLVSADGRILAHRRGDTISHQQIGVQAGMDRLVDLATRAARAARIDVAAPGTGAGTVAEIGAFCLAGADFPPEVRLLHGALEATGLTDRVIVHNDAIAVLRAGATRRWGVGIVCGQGINGVAIGIDGATAGFDAVGDISGDWGGASSVGQAALAAAVRASDGRGPATVLTERIATHFGRRAIRTVVRDLYYQRIAHDRLTELSPILFEAAVAGDSVARSIADHLADELLAMIGALVRRTGLTRQKPEIVVAGGVFRNRDARFYERLERGVARIAPGARLVRLAVPPVIGAALIGLGALDLAGDRAVAAEAELRRAGLRLDVAPGG